MSRTKLAHLMDAETWMDAGKAVELGFADEIIKRNSGVEDMEIPQVAMLYSKAAVVNSLMDKITEKCRIQSKGGAESSGLADVINEDSKKVTAGSLLDRLSLIKNWR